MYSALIFMKPAYMSLNTTTSGLPKGNFLCEYKVKADVRRDEKFFPSCFQHTCKYKKCVHKLPTEHFAFSLLFITIVTLSQQTQKFAFLSLKDRSSTISALPKGNFEFKCKYSYKAVLEFFMARSSVLESERKNNGCRIF